MEAFDVSLAAIRGLTKFELIELYHLQRSSTIEEMAILMTALFAFLGAAYFAASKLRRSQAYSIVILYSAFFLYMTGGIISSRVALAATLFAITDVEPTIGLSIIPGILLLVAWAYSIWFFVQERLGNEST